MNENSPYSGKNKRIGILGGTFNPIHLGHIHMADMAMEHLGLDRVVFMLCAIPAHKVLDYSTSSMDRLSMLKLAIDHEDRYIIDEHEAHQNEAVYTYQSLQRINKILDDTSEIFFIIGADSLMQIDRWRCPEILLTNASFAVIPRSGYPHDKCMEKIKILNDEYGAKIVYIDCTEFEMSSTMARDRVLIDNKHINSDVYRYMIEKGLYSMINTDKIHKYLQKVQSKKRYTHTLGVIDAAASLAKKYDVDVDKARLAALLHDCAKGVSHEDMISYAKKYGYQVDEILLMQPDLLHGPAGAYVAKNTFHVEDKEILDAIAYHTVPRLEVSKMDMIMSVADIIEEGRDFKGVKEIREIAKHNLEDAFILSLQCIIRNVLKKGRLMHPNSLTVYNKMLIQKKKSDKM